MNIRPNQAAILCCLGLFAGSSLPIGSSVDERGGILSAVIKPLRMIQREAVAQDVGNDITPSHVYQATSDLISEIEILRDAMGVTAYPIEAEAQDDRSPIHVYAKSLEVLEKISASQKRLGMAPARISQIPVKNIVAKDVFKSVQHCIAGKRSVGPWSRTVECIIHIEWRPLNRAGNAISDALSSNAWRCATRISAPT